MPRINVLNARQGLRSGTLPRVQARPTGLMQAGAAIQGLGAELGRLADAEDRADAGLRFSQMQGELQQRFTEAQENAERGAPGFTETFMDEFDQQTKEFLSSVPDRLQGEFALRVQNFRNTSLNQSQTFARNQRALKINDDIDDAITLQNNIIASNPAALDTALPLIADMINTSELRPEVRDSKLETARSTFFGTFITGEIQADPAGALADLKEGFYDELAQGNQKAAAMAQAERELDRRRREAERVAREAAVLERAEVASLLAAEEAAIASGAGSQGLVTPERVEAAFEGEKGRRLAEGLRQKQAVADQMAEIALLPAAGRADFLAGLPQPEGEDFDLEAQARNIGVAALQARDKALVDDPALFVLSHSPAVAEGFLAIEAAGDEDKAAATEAAVQASRELQIELLGDESRVRVLTKPQAQGIVQDVLTRPPREQGAALLGLMSQYRRFSSDLLAELKGAGLPDELAVAAIAFEAGDQVSASQAARAAELGTKEQKNLLGTDEATLIEDAVRSEAGDISATFRNAQLSGEVVPRLKGAMAMARQKVIEGTDRTQAAKEAVAAAFPFELATFSDSLAIPREVDAEAAELRLRQLQAGLRAEDIDLAAAAVSTGLPLDDAEIAEQYADSVRANGSWRNSRNGAQLVDSDGRPVPLITGEFLIEPWNAIEPMTPAQQRELQMLRRQEAQRRASGGRPVEDDLDLRGLGGIEPGTGRQ